MLFKLSGRQKEDYDFFAAHYSGDLGLKLENVPLNIERERCPPQEKTTWKAPNCTR